MGLAIESGSKGMDQRVGIFVDVQNMFYSAKLLHQSKLEYGKLLEGLRAERMLVRAIAYIVQKADVDQTSFHEALTHIGYELRVKELKVRSDPSSDRGSFVAKGSWDVGLAVEAMALAPRLDTVILVTGDGEFLPLVQTLRRMGLRVEVVGFEGSTSGELVKAADQFIPISSEWMFKEKKFETVSQAAPDAGVSVSPPLEEGSPAPGASPEEESQPEVPGQPSLVTASKSDTPSSSSRKRFGILG